MVTAKQLLTRINEHEKLCRIMQKETFKKIDELSSRIERLERVIIISAGVIITSMGGINNFIINTTIKITLH
jgi:hypothetical protein